MFHKKPKPYKRSSHATTSFSTLNIAKNEQKVQAERKEPLEQRLLSLKFDLQIKEMAEMLNSYNTEKQPPLIKKWAQVFITHYQDLQKNKRHLDLKVAIHDMDMLFAATHCFLFLMENVIKHGSKSLNASLNEITQKEQSMLETFIQLHDAAKKDSKMEHFFKVNRPILEAAEAYAKREIEKMQEQSPSANKPKA